MLKGRAAKYVSALSIILVATLFFIGQRPETYLSGKGVRKPY